MLLILGLVTTLLLLACFLAAETSLGSPVDLLLRLRFGSSLCSKGVLVGVTSFPLFVVVLCSSLTYASSGGWFSSHLSLVAFRGLDILHVLH